MLAVSRLALKMSTPTSGLARRRSAIRSPPSPSTEEGGALFWAHLVPDEDKYERIREGMHLLCGVCLLCQVAILWVLSSRT
jgi:hypothetical protein